MTAAPGRIEEAINEADARRFAECALAAVRTPYPHKLDHLILDAGDTPLPERIHPVFSGSYDWHSSVHMHWSLLRLCELAPGLSLAPEIEAHFAARFTAGQVAVERAYAGHAARRGFERPYGWAWLLKLQTALDARGTTGGAWSDALRPFSAEVARRLAAFFETSHYPVRAGTHANSAFAMLLGLDFAWATGHAPLREAIERSARRWFGEDRDYPAAYEPSGSDFLSGGLCEALLMRRVLGAAFADWWRRFQPSPDGLARWLAPAIVSDRVDAQLVHLDGLNLSRAWCLAALAPGLPDADLGGRFQSASTAHARAAWPHVTGGHFAATHWLVSFALLSLPGGSAWRES